MLVKYHVLAAGLALITFPFIGWFYALVIALSAVLIDFDHYLYYAVRFGDWNPMQAYKWYIKKYFHDIEYEEGVKHLLIFHGIECWVLLLMLSCLHIFFAYVLMGVALHMILDLIKLIYDGEEVWPKLSQILVYKHIMNNIKPKDLNSMEYLI